MRLVGANTFRLQYFAEGDQPDPRTVRSWVVKGVIPGRIINKGAYVDVEAFENSTGNGLADRILRSTSEGAGAGPEAAQNHGRKRTAIEKIVAFAPRQ